MEQTITLDQVKKAIKDGTCKMIYYSSRTPWWTHLSSDLEEATKTGVVASENAFNRMLNDPNVSQDQKDKFKSLRATIQKSPHQIPLDPSDAPCYEAHNPMLFVTNAESDPGRYGRHGIETFMACHHQNAGGGCFTTMESYNKVLDIQKGGGS